MNKRNSKFGEIIKSNTILRAVDFSILTVCILLVIATFLSKPTPVDASILTIYDNYWGADDHGYGDVVGDDWRFDIDWMEVSISGTQMTVIVRTMFDQKQNYPKGSPVLFGDLFISTNGWNPSGTPDNHYVSDNMSSGTEWDYAFKLNNTDISYNKGQIYDGNLYEISDGTITPSYAPSGWIWRDGQEALFEPAYNAEPSSSGSWFYEDESDSNWGQLTMSFGLPGNWHGLELGFHWGQTCGNDVIEGGGVITPEPATMMLVGVGLLGMAFINRRYLDKRREKMKKD